MIDKTVVELYNIFNFLNKELFKGECQLPVITIQANKGKRLSYGWCTAHKQWKDKVNGYYEINIAAEFLNREVTAIAETMLHEMVHLYNSYKEIKDCSNNNVYHNKEYKKSAEEHGLIVEKERTVGWAITKFNDTTKELIKKLQIDLTAFELYREKEIKINKDKQPSFKYECDCGIKFTLYKKLDIICKQCNKPFVVTEKEVSNV